MLITVKFIILIAANRSLAAVKPMSFWTKIGNMAARNIDLVLLLVAALAAAGQAQQEPRKTNVRPEPNQSKNPLRAKGEPYDKADVKTMAGKCVRLETELGNIELELYPEQAPESVRNFLNLAALGLYDTTTFSRVVPDFVIQGGNLATREGGFSADVGLRSRRTIPDEPNKIPHDRGVISMARSDEPHSASTHFFILVSVAPDLDGKFSAFGRVTKGMEVVDAINKAPVVAERPDKPVRIRKAIVFDCVSQ